MAELALRLTNVYGEPLGEAVDVVLRHQSRSELRVARLRAGRALARIRGLEGPPQGLYRILVDPPSYLPVAQFVNLAREQNQLDLVLPVDPVKVRAVQFPPFAQLPEWFRALLEASRAVLGFADLAGQDLYERLGDTRRAGLLNLAAKCARTPLANGRTVSTYLERLLEVRGDRVHAAVPRELREEVVHASAEGLFHPVDGSLHEPPPRFLLAGSFKTPDHYGNLQVTFFTDGTEHVADVDIDDAAGLEHVFQVVRNAVSGRPTHPYDIHQILVRYQHLDPGYRFVLA
jgi:hypothetical protein